MVFYERQWSDSLSFFLQKFRRGIFQNQNEEKEIIPWRDNLFFFALEQSAERRILFACKNECTHFYNRGSREQSSFVRSRVKPRPVTCALATCSTGYFLSPRQFYGFENGTSADKVFEKTETVNKIF